MTVPKGKTVYYGGKKLVPGSEISDSVAELVGLKKPLDDPAAKKAAAEKAAAEKAAAEKAEAEAKKLGKK